MQTIIKQIKKAYVETENCVACGCCVKVCPRDAISVPNGICALVALQKCIGCGLCARECPASIISLLEVPA